MDTSGSGNVNLSFQKSFLNSSSTGFNKSFKRRGDFLGRKTPSKTPRKSPGRAKNGTPGRDGTPGRNNTGDRFIPNRSAMDFESSYHKIVRETFNNTDEEMMSPSKLEYQKMLQDTLNITDGNSTKILAFNSKAPPAADSYANSLKVLYSNTKAGNSCKKSTRHIPQSAERILDAPEIMDDYYLNLVDWGSNNQLAVALGTTVYIWNAESGAITPLMEIQDGEYVCSLRWITEGGNHLAIGTSDATVQLWDVAQCKRSRVITGHESRVSCLAWNQYILSSGSRSGAILHSDVRVAEHLVARSDIHSQEVCGLTWSQDGRYLASGGNDNLVCVWSSQGAQCFASETPHLTITEHQAAVRALAWCPWQPGLLASGGGSSDRAIKIWNCNNGRRVTNMDTKSQVCSLVWNEHHRELVSSHGYPSHEINIWKYPSISKVAELTGHSGRVLTLCLSPDGTTLLSAGADETLRLWNCFPVDQKKKEVKSKQVVSALKMGIR